MQEKGLHLKLHVAGELGTLFYGLKAEEGVLQMTTSPNALSLLILLSAPQGPLV